MGTLALTILASLFSVVNPLGAIPMFLALSSDYEKEEHNHASLMTSIYFTIILIVFFWAGTLILGFFGVSIYALRIAGGIVIMMSGFALLSGNMAKRRVGPKAKKAAMEKEDISFTPMAMPMLSGPGSISLLIGYFTEYSTLPNRLMITGVVVIMGLIVFLVLRFSPLLFKLMGVGGLRALARIMGFIVLSIGVQYVITGIVQQVSNLTAG